MLLAEKQQEQARSEPAVTVTGAKVQLIRGCRRGKWGQKGRDPGDRKPARRVKTIEANKKTISYKLSNVLNLLSSYRGYFFIVVDRRLHSS